MELSGPVHGCKMIIMRTSSSKIHKYVKEFFIIYRYMQFIIQYARYEHKSKIHEYVVPKFYSHQLMHLFIQLCISLLSYIKIT